MLGGSAKPVNAYAGGIVARLAGAGIARGGGAATGRGGYKALKLRGRRHAARDIARVRAVREAFGDELVILVDANTEYTVDDVRAVMPAMEELGVGWLEEPFPAHDYASYGEARTSGACRSPRARTTLPASSSPASSMTDTSASFSRTCRRRAASRKLCGSPRWPRPGSCRSTRIPR